MRVGFLTYGLDRNPTGIGRYTVQLARALAASPRDLELVVLATERDDVHGLREVCEYHVLNGTQLLPSLMTLGNAMLPMAARRYGLDIIHDPNGIAPFLGPALGIRRIVTIHDTFAYVYPQTHNRLDNWRFRWQLPQAARRADAVVTVSECSRRDLIRFLKVAPQKVHVSSEGIESRFAPVADGVERRAVLAKYGIASWYLLYVGGLNARKNIASLLEAFSRICQCHPDLTLVIGGKRQWQTGDIDRSLDRLGLDDRVCFTGYIDDDDLPALYSAAEAFVFPSLYEGFGLPPLEAMACGTPVIASSASSLPEVVGDAAMLVIPTDVDALAKSIIRVLNDEDLRADLRRRGRARAAGFTWERAARETLAVYEEIMARSGVFSCPTG